MGINNVTYADISLKLCQSSGYESGSYGKRGKSIISGCTRLVLAAVMFFYLREPTRGGADTVVETGPRPGLLKSVAFMFSNPALRQLLIASTVTGMMSCGASTWIPTFFIRIHDLSQSEVGLLMALVFGVLGAAGTLIGGRLFDRVSRRGFHRGVWLIGAVQVASIPLSILAYQADSFALAIGLFLFPAFAGNFFLGPTLAQRQTLFPVPMRAVAAAIKMFCLNLVGLSLGPLLVGSVSDWLKPAKGDASLGFALSVLAVLHIWSAFHFWLCGRALHSPQ
jgi:predicted MFS family arabinose efflux permease